MNKIAFPETDYQAANRSALEQLIKSTTRRSAQPTLPAAGRPMTVIGKVVGFTNSRSPLVAFEGNPEPSPLTARHTCNISLSDTGREAVLVFAENDVRQPIILGLLQPYPAENNAVDAQPATATLDGKQVTLTAENEIVLRCGKASITLTRAGKVLINGEYLLSRSNGANRIKGGSVQIN